MAVKRCLPEMLKTIKIGEERFGIREKSKSAYHKWQIRLPEMIYL